MSVSSFICNFIKINEQTRNNLRSCNELLLEPPSAWVKNKKTLEDKSFQVAATRLWNTLPSEIRAIRGYNLFKGAIKRYLFKKVFPYL